VAFSSIYHEHDLNSNHDLINYIGILPYYNTLYLPLAGSLLSRSVTIFIPRLANAIQWRIKGKDICVLEGRKGLLYVKGVTLCLSSQERGILWREKRKGEREEEGEVKGAVS
jgi:hypothetical protein